MKRGKMIDFIKKSPKVKEMWIESDFKNLTNLTNKVLREIIIEIKEK